MLRLKKYIIIKRQRIHCKSSVTANTEIAIHDSNIKLYESLGIKQVYVEDFEHKSFSKAKKALEEKGFKVESKEEYSDDIDEGDVISQSPKGKSVDEGQRFHLLFLKVKVTHQMSKRQLNR